MARLPLKVRGILRPLLFVSAGIYLGLIVISSFINDQYSGNNGDPYLAVDVKENAGRHLVRRALDLSKPGNPELHWRHNNRDIKGSYRQESKPNLEWPAEEINYDDLNRRETNITTLLQKTLVLNQPYLCNQVDHDDGIKSETPNGNLTNYVPVYLLIIVHSHPGSKRRRNAIRATWGRIVHNNGNLDNNQQVVLVFLLGMPSDFEEYHSIRKEAALYRDVVMFDFVDNYRNLTTKSLLGLYWAQNYCSSARYIMKADDDIYLNVPLLLHILEQYPQNDLVLGSRNPRSPVKRYGQWEVSYKDYPYQHFPPYCSGCAYILSADVASRLSQVSLSSQSPNQIPVEDVYVTGLLSGKLGLTCTHHPLFPNWITVPTLTHIMNYLQGVLLGLHGVDWVHMHALGEIIQGCANCSTDLQQARSWFSWFTKKDPMYR